MKARRHRLAYPALALAFVVGAAVLASRGDSEASRRPTRPAAFAWLRPRAVPATWSVLRLPGSPARLPLPSAAAPPRRWAAESSALRRAVAGFQT